MYVYAQLWSPNNGDRNPQNNQPTFGPISIVKCFYVNNLIHQYSDFLLISLIRWVRQPTKQPPYVLPCFLNNMILY